mmetsp:Transcript_6160/g.15691  ORF Transcript_6160/g.15691 Transcript_6160/m.15691 type:complete len:277 (-) Transcript_6160:659-1489(-)
MDVQLVKDTIKHIATAASAAGSLDTDGDGAILVFLTGWDEITKLNDLCLADPVLGDHSRCRVLPLHGAMPTANQREIFERPPRGIRKIVIATNIAETFITVDDVVYVVDTGKSKEKTYDAVNNLSCLLPTWVSKASAHQRRGRAGRVKAGVCYACTRASSTPPWTSTASRSCSALRWRSYASPSSPSAWDPWRRFCPGAHSSGVALSGQRTGAAHHHWGAGSERGFYPAWAPPGRLARGPESRQDDHHGCGVGLPEPGINDCRRHGLQGSVCAAHR